MGYNVIHSPTSFDLLRERKGSFFSAYVSVSETDIHNSLSANSTISSREINSSQPCHQSNSNAKSSTSEKHKKDISDPDEGTFERMKSHTSCSKVDLHINIERNNYDTHREERITAHQYSNFSCPQSYQNDTTTATIIQNSDNSPKSIKVMSQPSTDIFCNNTVKLLKGKTLCKGVGNKNTPNSFICETKEECS